MQKKMYKAMASIGIALMSYFPTDSIEAQEYREDERVGSAIESMVDEDYHRTTHTVSSSTNMEDIDGLNTSSKESLEWLLDTYNTPLSQGDELGFIETEMSGVDYPYSVSIDYDESRKEDLFLLGEAEDLGYAIRVNYHDENGDHVRSLWINKDNQDLFDIVSHDIEFPVEGYFENLQRRISSGFGPRTNPLMGAYGGPDSNNHNGIDIPLPEGTEISSPLEGRMRAGYAGRTPGTNGYNTFMHLGKTLELNSHRMRRNSNRRAQRDSIQFQFFHLSDYPENIKTESAEALADRYNITGSDRQEYVDWYRWIMSSDDEQAIFRNIQNHDWNRIFFPWIDIERNNIMGYTGNTGMSTGGHIHIGVRVNGDFVDPEEFFERYGVRRGWSEEETQENIARYERIRDILND